MDAPSSDDINSAARQLQLLAAAGEEGKLDRPGQEDGWLPLEPRLTAAILAAGELGCGEEMLTNIAPLVHWGDCSFNVPGTRERREEAEMVHRKFLPMRVTLSLTNAWRAYKASISQANGVRNSSLSPDISVCC